MIISELQDLQEEFRQRVPASETHDLARRVGRAQKVQMHRLRKGFQIQAPPQGKHRNAFTAIHGGSHLNLAPVLHGDPDT